MRKIYHCISIFQVLLLIAAYTLQELSTKKMGVMRYLVYLNQKWEAQYPG